MMIMILPFRYGPGHLCIFFSSSLYHKVGKWVAKMQTSEMKKKRLTPGRIGTVLFFPKDSLRLLEDKPEGWASKTSFGKFPHGMQVISPQVDLELD